MIALRIEEQKKFTSGLFIGELFDQFLLRGGGHRHLQPVHHRRPGAPGLLYRRGAGGGEDR